MERILLRTESTKGTPFHQETAHFTAQRLWVGFGDEEGLLILYPLDPAIGVRAHRWSNRGG